MIKTTFIPPFWSKDTIDKMIYMLKSDKDSTLNKFYKNFFLKLKKETDIMKDL